MRTLGRSGDDTLVERFTRALAAELRAVGISLDFTPVLDILTNPKNPAIGDRALAETADEVGRIGSVIIRTLQAEGIAASGKHFPGHGDTGVDSHHDLPIVEHPPDRIERVELVPFRAAIDADVASIMTAHILIPAIDEERPATLSPAVVTGMLNESLGFKGLVLSDDIGMSAISARYGTVEATVTAIAAGCDAVLMCGTDQRRQSAALEALIHAVEDGRLPLKRVEDALARQRRAKERFLAPPRPLAAPGQRAAKPPRPRRASGGGRRNGEIRLRMRKPRALRSRRPHRHRRARQPVRPRRIRRAASRSSARSASTRVTRRAFSTRRSYAGRHRRVPRGGVPAAWADPSIAAPDRGARRLRQRAAAAAARSQRCARARRRRSSATATTRRC